MGIIWSCWRLASGLTLFFPMRVISFLYHLEAIGLLSCRYNPHVCLSNSVFVGQFMIFAAQIIQTYHPPEINYCNMLPTSPKKFRFQLQMLQGSFQHPHPQVRRAAWRILGSVPDCAWQSFLQCMEYQEPGVRRDAITGLRCRDRRFLWRLSWEFDGHLMEVNGNPRSFEFHWMLRGLWSRGLSVQCESKIMNIIYIRLILVDFSGKWEIVFIFSPTLFAPHERKDDDRGLGLFEPWYAKDMRSIRSSKKFPFKMHAEGRMASRALGLANLSTQWLWHSVSICFAKAKAR